MVQPSQCSINAFIRIPNFRHDVEYEVLIPSLYDHVYTNRKIILPGPDVDVESTFYIVDDATCRL